MNMPRPWVLVSSVAAAGGLLASCAVSLRRRRPSDEVEQHEIEQHKVDKKHERKENDATESLELTTIRCAASPAARSDAAVDMSICLSDAPTPAAARGPFGSWLRQHADFTGAFSLENASPTDKIVAEKGQEMLFTCTNKYRVISGAGAALRSGPSPSSNKIGTLLMGDEIQVRPA